MEFTINEMLCRSFLIGGIVFFIGAPIVLAVTQVFTYGLVFAGACLGLILLIFCSLLSWSYVTQSDESGVSV